ncbi:MAG: phage integrase N-terminal SAM-like domain-containing protein [Bacteroidetes bacterium]|nr:phage integrase N-terminal SAM-like domain-containing protein [Bacteroidota bacterium]
MNRSKSRLIEQVRINLRTNHYGPKTEESYINWIKRFILFLNKRHPSKIGETEIKSFLEDDESQAHFLISSLPATFIALRQAGWNIPIYRNKIL